LSTWCGWPRKDNSEQEESDIDRLKLAQAIDHTLLRADGTQDEVRNLCREAREFGFGAVCVNPCFVSLAARELDGTGVKVCTVIGFPLGANAVETKVTEARLAATDGAHEIDIVLNIGALKEGDSKYLMSEADKVIEGARDVNRDILVKLIAETGFLTADEKLLACWVATGSGADYIKNATGYGPTGAQPDEIRFLRKAVGSHFGVKAAGGIRDLKTALALLEAGADRLGTSSGIRIIREWPAE